MGNNQEILETLDILIEHSKKCRPSETGHGVTLALANYLKILVSQNTVIAHTPLYYFREGYKYCRSFNEKSMPYDEAAENTMIRGYEILQDELNRQTIKKQ